MGNLYRVRKAAESAQRYFGGQRLVSQASKEVSDILTVDRKVENDS